MGCVCVKQAHIHNYADSPDANGSNRTSTWSLVFAPKKKPHTNHAQTPRSEYCYSQRIEGKRKENIAAASSVNEQKILERGLNFIPGNLSRHIEAEQVAAGWPDWLAAVAGEAINGWIPRRADSFERLYKIGQGTYSNVYKARDLYDGKIVALKMVRFDNLDPESVRFMAREIQILRRLDHPNVVKLEGLITSGMSRSMYLVLEYMEHDLAGLASRPGIKFTEPQVKCYMQQLFRGLDHCHSRGVLHRDIKGSNLLIDNGGILKLADFGLATFFHPNQRQPLTSRVVTLWYRSPELLLGATDYGAAVDLWSTGCILAELLFGKPLMPGRTEVEQLHKIFKLCGSPSEEYWKKSKLPYATLFKPQQPYKRRIAETFKEVPSSTLALLETLLAIEPSDRGAAAGALKSEFFTTKPFPCNPSSLPTYPRSKELDAKVHEEEARRQIAAQGRGHRFEGIRRKSKQSRIGPTLDDSIESTTSIQKPHLNSQRDSKHRTKKFNTQQEGDTVGFPIYPLRPMQSSFEITAIPQAYALLPGSSYSGPILCTKMSNSAFGKKQKDDDAQMHASLPSDFKTLEIYGQPPVADLSDFSRLMAGRNYVRADTHRDQSALQWNYADGLEDVENGKYEISRVPDISIKQKRTQSQRPKSFKHPHSFQSWNNHGVDCRRDENFAGKEPVMGYVGQERRIHCSGPLLPPSANFDEILERHEQHLRRVVHRAQEGKDKAQRGKLYHTRKKAFECKGQGSTAKGNAESYDLKSGELNIVYGW